MTNATMTPPNPKPAADEVEEQRSLWSDAWRSLRKNPYFIIGAALSVIFTVMAIYPPLFTGFRTADDHTCQLSNSTKPPSADAPFGYDILGCDLFILVPHGAQISMSIALVVTVSIAIFSVLLGAVAGYYGKIPDAVISRIAEMFYAIPTVLGATVVLTVLFSGERELYQVAIPLIIFSWMTPARLVRSAVLSIREMDYVAAARMMGASVPRIVLRHVLPNAIAPLIVYLTIMFGQIIAAEAVLSFLGIGMQKPAISWGLQISEAQDMFSQGQAIHMLLFPALFVSLAVLSFVLMGDALRDALDPKSR